MTDGGEGDRKAEREQMITEAKAAIEEAHRIIARIDEDALTALLTRLSEHPEQLEPAPETDRDAAIEHRRLHETHPCAHCGKPATVAFIVGTENGIRWLDLCAPHGEAVQKILLAWNDEQEV
jgi:hypothetical protein